MLRKLATIAAAALLSVFTAALVVGPERAGEAIGATIGAALLALPLVGIVALVAWRRRIRRARFIAERRAVRTARARSAAHRAGHRQTIDGETAGPVRDVIRTRSTRGDR